MLTKSNADVYEVEFEDGTKVCGTYNHPIMMEDGSWVELGNLITDTMDVKTITSIAKVKSMTNKGKADVYNMMVEDTHDFVIQGGIVAHNCDSIRYFCMMRPIAPRLVEEKEIPMYDPLNQFEKESYNKAERFGYLP